jgi:hypothetical protein
VNSVSAILASALCVVLAPLCSEADPLDDAIAGMRSGAPAPAGIQAAIDAQERAARKSYSQGLVDLYLAEIKTSIVDDANNGGWPCRSFLVDGDPNVREDLTAALKERFDEKPDGILAYALICPALYADDAPWVDRLQAYLKGADPFLYKLEQAKVDVYWGPYIVSERKAALALLLGKVLPLIASGGTDREVAPVFASPLGLSPAGAAWQTRQLVLKDSANSTMHGFAISRGTDPDIILSRRDAKSVYAFRSSRDGELVSAIMADRSTKQVTLLSRSEAKAEFDSEWKFWYNNIDDAVGASAVK